MEVITMLKFWKSNNNSKVAAGTTSSDGETFASSTLSDHLSEYSDDDDFFELELDSKHSLSSPFTATTTSLKKSFIFEDDERENEVKLKSKPQSPISILRAAASPKLQVFMFGRFSKKSKHSDEVFDCCETISSPKRSNSSLFTVKFRIEDGSIVPKLTRSGSNNSSSVSSSPKIEKLSSDNLNETSKRFSKDSIQKYINRIKPKSSTKNSSNLEKFVASPTRPSTTTSSSRFKAKSGKQLGKCKSASAVIGVNHQSPTNLATRNECPQDGIEGAILHCKRSFSSSSIGHSSLSRCSSDPSHEKSIQVSEVI